MIICWEKPIVHGRQKHFALRSRQWSLCWFECTWFQVGAKWSHPLLLPSSAQRAHIMHIKGRWIDDGVSSIYVQYCKIASSWSRWFMRNGVYCVKHETNANAVSNCLFEIGKSKNHSLSTTKTNTWDAPNDSFDKQTVLHFRTHTRCTVENDNIWQWLL